VPGRIQRVYLFASYLQGEAIVRLVPDQQNAVFRFDGCNPDILVGVDASRQKETEKHGCKHFPYCDKESHSVGSPFSPVSRYRSMKSYLFRNSVGWTPTFFPKILAK